MAQTAVTIHIDEDIKNEAEFLFNKIGLNMSTAINVFFHQAVREQAIPFELKPYDHFYNSKESIEALKEAKQLMKNPTAKSFKTTKDLIDDLLNGNDDE
jgi:DNA-damage-inducible protein J